MVVFDCWNLRFLYCFKSCYCFAIEYCIIYNLIDLRLISHCSVENYYGLSAFIAVNWSSNLFYLPSICYYYFAELDLQRNFSISYFLFTFSFLIAGLLTDDNFMISLFEEMIINLDQQILYFDFFRNLLPLLLPLLPHPRNHILHLSLNSLTSFVLFLENDLFSWHLFNCSSPFFVKAYHYFPLELSWQNHFLLDHISSLKTKPC